MLRDRLATRMAAMGEPLDYPRLAADVLGIHGAPPALARRLVAQALVIEDREESWQRAGLRICRAAPTSPGVYVLRDADGRALYVGKAVNVRRRLRSHFAPRRWHSLKPAVARVATAEWREVGSEIEALLLEADLIRQLQPATNVQVGPPALRTRKIPAAIIRDVVAIVPSVEADCAELVAARVDGAVLVQRTSRSGASLDRDAARVCDFFRPVAGGSGKADEHSLAALVFSWLARRGVTTTRLDPHQWASASEFCARIGVLLQDEQLFAERLVII